MTEKVDHLSGSSRSLDHVCVCVCVCPLAYLKNFTKSSVCDCNIRSYVLPVLCIAICLFIIDRTAIAHFHHGSLEDATIVHVHYEETAFVSAVAVDTFANDSVTGMVAYYDVCIGVRLSSPINCDKERKQARAMDIPTDCAICLEELSVDDTELARPCDHRFHRWCLEMWLQQVYYVGNIHV